MTRGRRLWWKIGICAAILVVAAGVASVVIDKPAKVSSEVTFAGGRVPPPSPLPVTINPSAPPRGDTIPTGLKTGDNEMILYFWGSGQRDIHLTTAWRNTKTQQITDGVWSLAGQWWRGAPDNDGFLTLSQMPVDRGVFEFGAFRGSPERITSTVDGKSYDAAFTTWSADASVVVFWLHRAGTPAPHESPVNADGYRPIPDEKYPLITAYDAAGNVMATQRLKNPPSELKGG